MLSWGVIDAQTHGPTPQPNRTRLRALRSAFSALALLSLCFLLPGGATGAPLLGIGAPLWAQRLDATTTAACVPASNAGATPCALFHAGTALPSSRSCGSSSRVVATIVASAASRVCWALAPGLPLSGLTITDAGGPVGTRPGACRSVRTLAPWTDKPDRGRLLSSGGARLGLCSIAAGPTAGGAGETLYAPCGADADCTAYGGGVCRTGTAITTAQAECAGAFLTVVADATASVDVTKEAVVER